MEKLKKEAEQEQNEFQNEWNKLEKLIEQDKQVKNFIKNKKQGEESKKITDKASDSKDKKEDISKATAQNAVMAERKVLRKIADKGHSLHKETTSTMDDMMKVQEYEEAFNSIKEATQINDIDALIEQFEKAENNNFSLLKYVESLSADIKDIDEEIKMVQNEIDMYTKEGNEDIENNRDKQFKKINDELEKTEKETKEYERQYQETIKTINALKIGIKSIFDRIGCNNESVQEIVCGAHGVTESNMMQYLGIIEQRTNEILQMYSACQVKSPFEANQPKASQPVQAKVSQKPKLDFPNINDAIEDKLDVDEFMSPNQLRLKAEANIMNKKGD